MLQKLTADSLREELNLNVGSRYVCLPQLHLSRVANMAQSIVVLIFFVPYVVFQPFMTVLTRKLGPTLFLGCIITSWGGIMIVRPPLPIHRQR
jgi:MFS family permease